MKKRRRQRPSPQQVDKPAEDMEEAMSYYRTCRICGAHLDPGEVCDCKKEDKPSDGKKEESKPDGKQEERRPA